MMNTIYVLRGSVLHGFADLKATYTWRSWSAGWLVRVITQVMFFALLGRLLGSPGKTFYIAEGNAVAIVSIEACIVILSVCGERATGTLPLIVAAPGNHLPVYLGRGVQWLCTGLVSSTVAVILVPLLLGLPMNYLMGLNAIPAIAIIGFSTYCYGCFLGCLALRFMRVQWLFLNVGYLILLTFCGVDVPVDTWPLPIRVIANLLPLTHGLRAVRYLLSGDVDGTAVIVQLLLEVAVGLGWLVVAAASCQRLVSAGRADGSIEFS